MIADVSSVIAMMNEVKRFHREGNWSGALERYPEIRQKIISLHNTGSNLTEEHKTFLTGASQHFSDMETRVERVVARSPETVDAPRLNKIVSAQVDRLNEILVTLGRNIGN